MSLEARVVAVVCSIVGERSVGRDQAWRDLGLDSLDLLSLVVALEDEFGVQIPDLVAIKLRNVADVVALLEG